MAGTSYKNMGKLKKSPWIIAASVLALVLNFIFSSTVLRSQERDARELAGRADGLRSAISGKAAGGRQDVHAASFIEGLPESSGLSSILDEVFASAKANGLDVASAVYNSEAFRNSNLAKYEFTFPVEGRYRDIKSFLCQLESSPRPFVIEELGLVSRKAIDGKICLNINISILYRTNK